MLWILVQNELGFATSVFLTKRRMRVTVQEYGVEESSFISHQWHFPTRSY